jgi:hypothetical protein
MCIVLPALAYGPSMTKFRVGERFHSDSKARKVAAKAPAALGLWAIAGSWSADKLSEGFVDDDDLPWLFPDAVTLAAELVAAGLWKRVKGGHQFVDWLDDNPSKDQVLKEREAARKRMAALRSGEQRKRSGEVRPNKHRTGGRTSAVVELPKGSSSTRAREAQCTRHAGWPASNCGACRSEELSPP